MQSFDHAAVLEHKRLRPCVPAGAIGAPPIPELGTYATWAAEISPMHWAVDGRYVDVVHRHGMRCNVWTVNRPGHMRRAADLGVDGVITNRPRALQQVLSALSAR